MLAKAKSAFSVLANKIKSRIAKMDFQVFDTKFFR